MGIVQSTGPSGLESIIQQYMAIEKRPLSNMLSQKSNLRSTVTLFEGFKSQLNALQNVVDDLKDSDSSSAFQAVKVESSDKDSITVTGSDNAAEGNYDIRVRQLATSTTMRSTATLNTAVSTKSSQQVVPGSDEIDTSLVWEEAGFSNTPTGTVSFNSGSGWKEFTLANYDSVDEFLNAVNGDSVAGVNIYYNENADKFVLDNDNTGGTLQVRQSTTDGFLAKAKFADESSGSIITDTADHTFSFNNSGVQTSVYLYETNFDATLSETDTGSFEINGATIEWDAGADTFADIIYRINSSDADVTAFYNESLDKITITSNSTGNESILFKDVEGDLLADVLKLDGVSQDLGDNALFTVNSNSLQDEITELSNIFTLNGLTIELNSVTVTNDDYADANTSSIKISSERDIEAIEKNINQFLQKFNGVADYLKSQMSVNVTIYTRNALAGESIVRTLRSNLINIVLQQVSGIQDGDPSSLSQIGITFNNDLNLEISDSTVLREFLTSSPGKVSHLFQDTNGIATRIYDSMDVYTETYDGLIDQRKEILADQILGIDKRIDRFNERMEIKEAQYRSQLTGLQALYIQVIQQQALMNSIISSSQQFLQ
jgi:flagellar hook-associated protein 2